MALDHLESVPEKLSLLDDMKDLNVSTEDLHKFLLILGMGGAA